MRGFPAVLLVAAACSMHADFEGTRYLCADGVTCPPGHDCVDGVCVAGGVADAAAIDAVPADGGPDAVAGADGPAADAPAADAATIDAVAADAPAADSPPALDPPWWNAAWTRRRRLTVHNAGAQATPAALPVSWRADVTGLIGAVAPWRDLRIVRFSASTWTEVTRVIDPLPAAGFGWIWFAVAASIPAGGDSTEYWVYYGNPAPGAAPGGPADVFPFHDPFDTLSTGVWAVQGSASVISGELALDSLESVRTQARWEPGHAVDFGLRFPTLAGAGWMWGGFHRENDFLNEDPWYLWISRDASTIQPEADTTADPVWVGTVAALDTATHVYTVERFSRRIIFRRDGQAYQTRDLGGTMTSSLQVRLANEWREQGRYDFVRVRPAVDPAPTVSVGAEEAAP